MTEGRFDRIIRHPILMGTCGGMAAYYNQPEAIDVILQNNARIVEEDMWYVLDLTHHRGHRIICHETLPSSGIATAKTPSSKDMLKTRSGISLPGTLQLPS